MSDRAQLFSRCSYICILLMVVAQTHEIFPRLFYRIPKNPRSREGNPVLGTRVTLWRKTKEIFGISSSSCIGPDIKRAIFVKVNFGKTWPKATGLTGKPVLDIHITLWRKTKMIFGIKALNYVELYVAQHIFFLKKTFYFLKDYSLSGIRLFLTKWKPFPSQKTVCQPAYAKAPQCAGVGANSYPHIIQHSF
jgi:hypothetical protein